MKNIILLLLLSLSLMANIGTVMAAKGSALLKSLDGKEVSVVSGLKLSEGDTILTQKKSRVQIMLLDETVVTVGSSSKFSFDEYKFDGKKSVVAMSASRGFFRSVTGKIGKLAPQRFKVKTSSATIGIRGTDFWGITGGKTETVTCNKGAITIEYEGEVIEVSAGNYATYGASGVTQGKIEERTQKDSSEDKKEESKEQKDEGTEEPDEEVTETPSAEDVANDPSQNLDIPTEDIADITQAVSEPFSLTPTSEDREQQY